MKSDTTHLQPILGMLRSTVSEDVLPQKCTTPLLGCKRGKVEERMKKQKRE